MPDNNANPEDVKKMAEELENRFRQMERAGFLDAMALDRLLTEIVATMGKLTTLMGTDDRAFTLWQSLDGICQKANRRRMPKGAPRRRPARSASYPATASLSPSGTGHTKRLPPSTGGFSNDDTNWTINSVPGSSSIKPGTSFSKIRSKL